MRRTVEKVESGSPWSSWRFKGLTEGPTGKITTTGSEPASNHGHSFLTHCHTLLPCVCDPLSLFFRNMEYRSQRSLTLPRGTAPPWSGRSGPTSRGHKMMILSTNFTLCKGTAASSVSSLTVVCCFFCLHVHPFLSNYYT